MMRRPAGRRPAANTAPKPRIARIATYPAPSGGWIKNQNLATPGARLPDGSKVNGAFVLENWFPTATGVRMRGGSELFATVGDGTSNVESMFAYSNGNNERLFAATASDIYDITNPLAPGNELLINEDGVFLVDDDGKLIIASESVAGPSVSELTSGNWSVAQFATPAGVFLRAVNGADDPIVFDGAYWSQTPAITGTGLVAKSLSYTCVHQRRMFFIERDSLSAWYLPADSIGGVAVELPLGAVFGLGGSLLFGSAWSIESGDGLNEQCVFVTTEGEAAIFQGTDPSVAASWTKVGVYRIGRPLGARAHIRAGGDLVIATDIGFVPLSQAIQRDVAALSPSAISYRIETAWNEAVESRFTGWQSVVWPTKQMVLVALPGVEGDQPQMFAANARTGAWGLFTGWNGKCLQLFRDRLFFGSTAGRIIEAEVGGSDGYVPYTASCVPLFDGLKAPASLKTSQTMRATLRSAYEVLPRLSLQADYTIALPPSPDAVSVASPNVWGAGTWGVSQWGVELDKKSWQQWQSVGGSGYAVAPGVQITSGSIVPPDIELVQVDLTYDQGDIVS